MTASVRKAWKKLSRMSGDEFRTRFAQEIGKRSEYALYLLGLIRLRDWNTGTGRAFGKFFFLPSEVPARVQLLRKHLPGAVADTLAEADEILRHRFRLLGYRDLDYGSGIDWHLDAVHGKRAPFKPWYKIRFLDFEHVGDHKIIWELNRHQHLVTLAKAWLFTNEQRYVQELVGQFYSWQAANPFPMGINWGSSLEVAFRSLSWLWVRHLLTGAAALPAAFDRDLVRGLARNGRYIERYLSTYFSPNTHLIGEAVALFFIGTLCPQLPAAARWQQKGLEIVLAEAQRQVRSDGVYFEQSLYYHVYALDFFLHTRALAASNGLSVPPAFDAVLHKMLEVLRVLSREGPPQGFGDDDGGRVFNPRRNQPEHMTDPLALGAALFGGRDLPQSAPMTEEALWLFGEKAVPPSDRLAVPLSSIAFEDGGLYVIASSGDRRAQMLVDAGPHGIGRGGHGHADALSVRLSINGRRWLVDPGAYVYISEGDERNQFRGTAAHNTVRVDKLDQAVPDGAFSWQCLPETCVEQWVRGAGFTLFSGHHTGYLRLPDPVLHRRMIFHLHGEYWLVRDLLEGRQAHEIEQLWHFAPEVHLAPGNNRLHTFRERDQLAVLGCHSHEWSTVIEPGAVSSAYGEQCPAVVAAFTARILLPAEHGTLLAPLGSSEECGIFRRTDVEGQAVGYQYQQDGVRDVIVFAKGVWSFGAIQSDAGLLWVRSREKETLSLALCSASFLQLDGHRVFSSPAPVERVEWSRTAGLSSSDVESLKFFDGEGIWPRTPVT